MANYRRGRINDEAQRVMAELFREVKDPRVSGAFISVSAVDVTADLKYAKIYYSVLGAERDAEKAKGVAQGLKSASGFIRRRLSEELNLRITPELSFIEDRSAANGAHIASILEGISRESKNKISETKDGEEEK